MDILKSPIGSQHNSGSGVVSETAFEDGLLDLGVPVQVQIFLWRQIAPFIRPKLGKLHEASCMVSYTVAEENNKEFPAKQTLFVGSFSLCNSTSLNCLFFANSN